MTELVLDVGAPAHGGFCVARHEGRVVFVRHALPGERVRAVITEDAGGSFCRADAVEVLTASAQRVQAPCPHAAPGRCGGCDWQHASAEEQRAIKAAVVREQFTRLAGIDLDLPSVEQLPGGLLGWRTRVSFAVGTDGTVGLHRGRSREIEPVEHCPLGVEQVSRPHDAPAGVTAVESVLDDDGAVAVLARRPGPGRQARGRRPPDRTELIEGPGRLVHHVGGRSLTVAADGFWQVHPQALSTFLTALLDAAAPQPGETVLDLYAGAGALTVALADAVGPTGRVIGVESSRQAVADAEANLAELPWAQVRQGRVDAALVAALGAEFAAEFDGEPDAAPDVVVLDPPRAGVGAAAMSALVALGPRCIAYLSCDPATLARDVRAVLAEGWQLEVLRAFDAFPMTQHVECLALLVPGASQP